ncbi:MAG: DUF1700 domain-containing protein [Bacillota bacterium]
MNYIEWRYKLQGEIALLSQEEQSTILSYYDELFSDKTDEGFDESEILKAFGSPAEVATELTAGLGSIDKNNDTPEYKASRAQQFKENFDKFQDKFNEKVNKFLKKAWIASKKFAVLAKEKIVNVADKVKSRTGGSDDVGVEDVSKDDKSN